MNAQIGKNVNHKFSLHNSSNRNGEHLIDFTLENRLTCFNTKFHKREGKLWTYCDTMSWIYAHTCIHTCVCAPIPVCACVCVCVCVFVCMYIYICVCAPTHTRTYMHAHTHAHTYTHIYMWRDELDSAWVSNFKC